MHKSGFQQEASPLVACNWMFDMNGATQAHIDIAGVTFGDRHLARGCSFFRSPLLACHSGVSSVSPPFLRRVSSVGGAQRVICNTLQHKEAFEIKSTHNCCGLLISAVVGWIVGGLIAAP